MTAQPEKRIGGSWIATIALHPHVIDWLYVRVFLLDDGHLSARAYRRDGYEVNLDIDQSRTILGSVGQFPRTDEASGS